MGEFEDMFARRQRDLMAQQASQARDEETNLARLRGIGRLFLDYIRRAGYPQDMAPDYQFDVDGRTAAAWALFDTRHPYLGLTNVYLLSDGRIAHIDSRRDSDNYPVGGYVVAMLGVRPVSMREAGWAIDLLQRRIDQLTTTYNLR